MLGQDGRAGTAWVAAVSALLACVLLAAVGVAALRGDAAGADTVLARGADAVLELADGSTRPAVEGETVPRGATVRAGRTGAELVTRERRVLLGGDSSVVVLDGVRQRLTDGFLMVESSAGPGLQVATRAAVVDVDEDSLVRVDGGALVRVGVLRGDAAAVSATGRRASTGVPTYYQVQVPTGGLPGAPTPFVLTPGDAYERELAADLVRADIDLEALAARLDADSGTGRVVLTALDEAVESDAAPVAGAPASERALGYLIATAVASGDELDERYADVRGLRSAGGSWGVVAAIVSAPVQRVSAALGALLEPGSVPVVASEPLDVGAVLGLGGSSSDPSGEPSGGSPDRGSDGDTGQQPPGSGGSGPSPAPSPTTGPADPVTETVDEVVDTVLDLVSSPTPTPVTVTVPPLLSTSPSPAPLLETTVQLPPLLR